MPKVRRRPPTRIDAAPNPTGPRDPMRRSIREDPGAVRTAPVAASQAA